MEKLQKMEDHEKNIQWSFYIEIIEGANRLSEGVKSIDFFVCLILSLLIVLWLPIILCFV